MAMFRYLATAAAIYAFVSNAGISNASDGAKRDLIPTAAISSPNR
jgi:hypothetical protein